MPSPVRYFPVLLCLLLLAGAGSLHPARGQAGTFLIAGPRATPGQVKQQAMGFVAQELQASLDAIGQPGQMPGYLFGEPTGGGFSWATVAGTLSRYQAFSGSSTLGRHQLAHWIKAFLLREVEGGNTTFSQLYVAEILLRHKGSGPLSQSAFWQQFTPAEQAAITRFLDVRRFYNAQKDDLGGRPNNYYGVAFLLAAHNHALGLEKDQAYLGALFEKCRSILSRSNGFLDDSRKQAGAYDRYHHEFVRFLWEGAALLHNKPMLRALRPVLRSSGRLWWDLFSPRYGHSSLWGRSRQNSWDDTFEQAAFFAAHPDLSPAPPAALAAAFLTAYHYYLQHDYNFPTHLNRMLDFGRGTWSYAGRNRIWSYTLGTLGKLSLSAGQLAQALEQAQVKAFDTALQLPEVNRFQVFRQGDRTYGVWVLRRGQQALALPVAGNGATSDYLPIPYGFAGLEAPVAQRIPALVPFLELADGTTLTTAQGADAVALDAAASRLQLSWQRLATLKGALSAAPLQASASWQLSGSQLTYTLELTASQPLELKSWQLWVPVSHGGYDARTRTFSDQNLALQVSYQSDLALRESLQATRDSDTGKGAFHPIPLLLKLESPPLTLEQGRTYRFQLQLNAPPAG